MSETIVRAVSPTTLSMEYDLSERGKAEILSVGGDYPQTTLSESIFMSFGLMHIVAPHLPRVIRADFSILDMARVMTETMYATEGQYPPEWDVPGFNPYLIQGGERTGDGVAVTYSGGKDSMWNVLHSRNQGYEPLAIHINGLNQMTSQIEHADVLKQQQTIGYQLAVVDLKNSPSQRGYVVMRSRDFFLTALAIPLALQYGADKILLEGNNKEGEAEAGQVFSYRRSGWELYNGLLQQYGVGVEMVGSNRNELDSIRDILEQQPDWLPLVSNCFTMKAFKKSIAAKFSESAPTFPLYESQCARCIKCRTVNLARIMYDPVMSWVDRDDIRFFISDTERWLHKKYEEVKDIMDPGFIDLLAQAKEQYAE